MYLLYLFLNAFLLCETIYSLSLFWSVSNVNDISEIMFLSPRCFLSRCVLRGISNTTVARRSFEFLPWEFERFDTLDETPDPWRVSVLNNSRRWILKSLIENSYPGILVLNIFCTEYSFEVEYETLVANVV